MTAAGSGSSPVSSQAGSSWPSAPAAGTPSPWSVRARTAVARASCSSARPSRSDQWSASPSPCRSGDGPGGGHDCARRRPLVLAYHARPARPTSSWWRYGFGGAASPPDRAPVSRGWEAAIQASSADVLWAMCPTGMMAQAFRSTDGGAQWSTLRRGELENSALLAPASDTTAVIQPSAQGQLLRTSDGGATWQSVYPSGSGDFWWWWTGFTDSNTGSALVREQRPGRLALPQRPLP